MARRISFLIFDDFQLLDAAGPIAAFECAAAFSPGAYRLDVRAVQAGVVISSSGVGMPARTLGRGKGLHTLLVAGGNGTRRAAQCLATRRFIRSAARAGARVASVCSGTYLLAAAGLLDGRRATTHWSRSEDFQRRFPRVSLDVDRIFVQSGNIWSSAGVTAGIDLALALITADVGEAVARRVAQQLVVYYRRPGGQSQFSELLRTAKPDGRFGHLLEHIRTHLREANTVGELAQAMAMSPRNFSRAFRAETGMPPAKAVEKLRADVARAALESGNGCIGDVAEECGFGDAERMRRTFVRLYGLTPSMLKR